MKCAKRLRELNKMIRVLYIIGLIAFLLLSLWLTRIITRRYKVNRWILAFTSPFIILVPKIAFPGLPSVVSVILFMIFSFTCIMFFEITRMLVENNEIKGVAKFPAKNTKK